MRISGVPSGIPGGVGGSMGPADVSGGMIDRLMDADQAPISAAKARQGLLAKEKNEYHSLGAMLGDLDGVLNGLKTPATFRKLAVESSHPDILSGVIDGAALPGSYEFEVKDLAGADRHLAVGFPDVDKTDVGFGWMGVEGRDGKTHGIVIDQGSTLKDVAAKINDSAAGVRAQIINTGEKVEPFRLLVASETTGEAAKVSLDPDSTFLDFKNIKAAKDLNVKFEDVDIKRSDNKLDDLLDGVKLNVKRADPGTKVTVNVTQDIDKTADGIKAFTDKYNQVARFSNQQFAVDPAAGRPTGNLIGASEMRSVMRSMQASLSAPGALGGKFGSLADIGVTTDAHSGELKVDEQKLKAALASDYDGVSKMFASTEDGDGLAGRMATALKRFKDPVNGVLKQREDGISRVIKDQDKQIENQTRRLDDKRTELTRRFAAMQGQLTGLDAQQQVITAKLGGDVGTSNGGGNGA